MEPEQEEPGAGLELEHGILLPMPGCHAFPDDGAVGFAVLKLAEARFPARIGFWESRRNSPGRLACRKGQGQEARNKKN
jgi:hypothetical protein